jgi:hypothetical protein
MNTRITSKNKHFYFDLGKKGILAEEHRLLARNLKNPGNHVEKKISIAIKRSNLANVFAHYPEARKFFFSYFFRES